MRRREFITLLGGAAVAWPLAARGQQRALPVVGFIRDGSADTSARFVAAFRKGLKETGAVEGQNVTVEYHYLEGQSDRLPVLMADLVRRQVAVIATPGIAPSLAAKAATATIPIVFGVGGEPVRLGLVASLARPGGNATGINFFNQEVAAKRLRLLHDLVPKAVRVAVLVNPANATSAENDLREVQQAAPTIGLQIQTILKATTIGEIDAAFASLAHERPDALFVAADAFFVSRAVQFATLAAHDRIPAAYATRDYVAAGGLMSYGTDIADMVSSNRRLYRPHPQGREARRPARVCSRPSSSSSSTLKRREHLASRCRRGDLHRRRGYRMRRREFITLLGSATAVWPLVARAQLRAIPVVGFLNSASPGPYPPVSAFLRGLNEMGFVDGQNVTIEYRWSEGEGTRLIALASELVRRPVAVLVTSSTAATLAGKAGYVRDFKFRLQYRRRSSEIRTCRQSKSAWP